MLRLAALVLSLATLLGVAACGQSESAGTGAPAQAVSPTIAPTTSPEVAPTSTATLAPRSTATADPTASPAQPSATPTGEVASTPTVEGVAAAPSLPAVVTDLRGNQVTVTDVSRIIPLTGDVAEIVWALGLGANVVATDTSATYPEAARALPKIGYQRQLAAEGILALKPTVVIGNEAAGPPEVLDQLRTAGTPVMIVANPPSLDTPAQKIRAVAAALGVSARGEALASQVEAEIGAAVTMARQATSAPSVMFLYVRGTNTQMIGGLATVSNGMIEAAGGTDAGAKLGIEGYKPLTAESLAAAQPDVLLLLTGGLESIGGIDGLVQIPGIAQTPAGQNRTVITLDDLYLLGLGPRTGQALRDLTLALHPELK